MTIMPGRLLAAADMPAVNETIERYGNHKLTTSETRLALMLLFDQGLNPELAPNLTAYLDTLLKRVACGEVGSEDAAADIHQLVHAMKVADPDFESLLDLGPDE